MNFLTEVEQYVVYLLQFTKNLMKKTVSWIKNKDKAVFWWSFSVAETVKKYRNTLQSSQLKKKIKRTRKKCNKIVHLIKTKHFRSTLYSVAINFSLMWKLVKWDCTFSLILLTHFVVFSLKILRTDSFDFNQNWYLVNDFENKVKVLQQQFFSEKSEADLADLNTTVYLQKIENNKLISKKKIWHVMTKLYLSKASERTDIINDFLKLMSKFLICVITCLIQDCQYWKYFSEIFKIIQIVAIWKIDKKNYQKFNFWKFITLLKIINKIVKAIMTTWLCNMIEKHNMLSSQQMKAH